MTRSTRFKLLALVLLASVSLTSCDVADSNNPNQGLVDYVKQAKNPQDTPVVAGEEYVNLDGSPAPAGTVLEGKTTQIGDIEFSEDPPDAGGPHGKHMFYSLPKDPDEQQRLVDSIPQDGPEYGYDLEEFKRAMQSGEPGRLVGIPIGLADTGYPLYPAKCDFLGDWADCTLDGGKKIDEKVLERKLTLVRNVDVLFLNITCGAVCVDNSGRVIGRVSVAMQVWRKEHCLFDGYGKAKCFEEDDE